MTTMATMDWAMQALGISMVPAGCSEAPARAIGLDGRRIDATVIVIESAEVNGLIRFDHVTPSIPAGSQSAAVACSAIASDASAFDCMAIDDATRQPAVIHAVHGVMETDDWFLLADVGVAVACREPPAGDIITTGARVR